MAQDFLQKNVTEELVDMHIDNCIRKSDVCPCSRCRADIRAYALNHLPQKYVVTQAGDLFVLLEGMSTQAQADIITAIMQGINLVKEHPRHEL